MPELANFARYTRAVDKQTRAAKELQEAWEIFKFAEVIGRAVRNFLSVRQAAYNEAKAETAAALADLEDGGIFTKE